MTFDPGRTFDPIAFNLAIDRCLAADVDGLRQHLVDVCGAGVLSLLDTLVRPRLLDIQIELNDDPHDWSAILNDRTPGTPGPVDIAHLDRNQYEQLALALIILFGPLLRWWSTATEVPNGLEDIWWLATSLIETAEDSEVDDIRFAEIDIHLRQLLVDATRVINGHSHTVAAELAELDDSHLYERVLETAEDVAQLVFPMGSTVLLDQILRGPHQ
jgi:hypothetical protein